MDKQKKHIRFDWAIKRILRDKANYVILEGFLTELIGEEILIKSILESESNKYLEDGKFNRVDLLVENSKGELIIIEIQNSHELDYFLRILFGISKAIVEYIKEGEPYSRIKKVISVNIIYFDLGQGEDYVYKGGTKFRGIHKDDVLELSQSQKRLFGKNNIEQLYPEIYLIKVNKFDDLAKDSLDEWIYFFKNSEIKKEFNAKGIKEAESKLRIMDLDEVDYKAYQKYLDELRYQAILDAKWFGQSPNRIGQHILYLKKVWAPKPLQRQYSIAETLKFEAEERVRKEEKEEIARMMLNNEEPIEKIIQYMGLEKQEIEKLK